MPLMSTQRAAGLTMEAYSIFGILILTYSLNTITIVTVAANGILAPMRDLIGERQLIFPASLECLT